MKLLSPAKINLFFRVLYKRIDGFHEVASLMQAISLFDEIYLERSMKDQFSCTNKHLPTGEENLVLKGLQVFRKKTGFIDPVAIHLKKNIPTQGGLGGGSSNCATILFGLSKLSGKNINSDELSKWAGEISSDAPFFFSSGTGYATGKGENVQSLRPIRKKSFIVAKPVFGLSTPIVYQHCEPNFHSNNPMDLLEKAYSGLFCGVNDLENPAFKLCPDLVGLKKWLVTNGFKNIAMTGSGTSFYCDPMPLCPNSNALEFFKVNTVNRAANWYGTY